MMNRSGGGRRCLSLRLGPGLRHVARLRGVRRLPAMLSAYAGAENTAGWVGGQRAVSGCAGPATQDRETEQPGQNWRRGAAHDHRAEP